MNPNLSNPQPQQPAAVNTQVPLQQQVSPSQPNPMNQTISPPTKNKSYKIYTILTVIIVLLLVGGGIAFYLIGKNGGKYTSGDLKKVTTDNYSVSYPKSWEDVSNSQDKLSQFGLATSDYKDLKFFENAINQNSPLSAAIFADSPSGLTDDQLKNSIDTQAAKDDLTQNLEQNFNKPDSIPSSCANIKNQHISVQYNQSAFVVEADFSADCTLPTGQSGHILAKIGFAKSNLYIGVIATIDSDWSKNSSFYTNDMMPSFSPN